MSTYIFAEAEPNSENRGNPWQIGRINLNFRVEIRKARDGAVLTCMLLLVSGSCIANNGLCTIATLHARRLLGLVPSARSDYTAIPQLVRQRCCVGSLNQDHQDRVR